MKNLIRTIFAWICALMFFLFFVSLGWTYTCDSTSTSIAAFETAIEAASPGDRICLQDGSYSTDLGVSGVSGTSDQEITISPETAGGATISGNINWNFTTMDYIIIEGFNFQNITGSTFMTLKDFSYGRLTDNMFDNTPDHTIDIRGTNSDFSLVGWSQNNTIDHNIFKNHVDTILIEVYVVHRDPDCGYAYTWHDDQNTGNTFEYNVFLDCTADNNREALQIGRGSGNTCYAVEADTAANTTVQYNLFDNWDDDEVISVKSASNTIQYNTFVNINGAVKNRTGNNNTYNGNIFDIGSETLNTKYKGLQIQGTGHVIKNNYLRGTDHGIILIGGDGGNDPDVDNVVVANNTFYDSEYGVDERLDDVNAPTNVTIINNHAERTGGTFTWRDLFGEFSSGTGITHTTNYVYCPSCPNDGVDPTITSGVTKLGAALLTNVKTGLPVNWYYPSAYNNGTYNANVTVDIQGQTRANPPDIGFDEDDNGIDHDETVSVGCTWTGSYTVQVLTANNDGLTQQSSGAGGSGLQH